MQEKNWFEYAVIRLVPRVERGEYLNIGLVLYCKNLKKVFIKTHLDSQKINCLFPAIDFEELGNHIFAFEKICNATPDSGVIGQQDAPSRFRWLTAKRSTIIQTSEVHPGFSSNIENTFDKIFKEMVL
ncbi:MAG: DUF3037 domain-containing protein [Cytophagaceae bacterium]|nr:DUF3037 domain-containing protein [Cytophagaceae bacterium]MBL0302827.1 DUF3037 domain-containing protein [Cytophagaceae bacterium]MBL0325654.1 DUF3037 domain-containing protein [Cytophagaceae bacterium]